MRRAVLLLPLLFLHGCSCQQPPPLTESAAAREGAAHADDVPPQHSAPTPPPTAAPPTALSAVAADALDEPSLVHRYLSALAQGDVATADAQWTGGGPGGHPDDAALRALPDFRGLRIKTSAPIARDTAEPSRLREVPVQIRVSTGTSTLRFEGWYRLQPRADGSGWEIHGASIQPVLN